MVVGVATAALSVMTVVAGIFGAPLRSCPALHLVLVVWLLLGLGFRVKDWVAALPCQHCPAMCLLGQPGGSGLNSAALHTGGQAACSQHQHLASSPAQRCGHHSCLCCRQPRKPNGAAACA